MAKTLAERAASAQNDFMDMADIEANGKKWSIRFKWFAKNKMIRVYDIHGDVGDRASLDEALQNFALDMKADKLEA